MIYIEEYRVYKSDSALVLLEKYANQSSERLKHDQANLASIMGTLGCTKSYRHSTKTWQSFPG
jgi:hypothetical protein